MHCYFLKISPQPRKNVGTVTKAMKKEQDEQDKRDTLIYTSYYDIDPDNLDFLPTGNPYGRYDGGSLDIQFKVDQVSLDNYTLASITIYGVDSDVLSQATSMEGRVVELRAGMGKGYPISNPALYGQILSGTVTMGAESWTGPDPSLTLYVKPFTSESDKETVDPNKKRISFTDDTKSKIPKNAFIVNIKQGDVISNALINCVKPHFKDYKIYFESTLAIDLKADKDFMNYYEKLEDFVHDIGSKEGSLWKYYTGLTLSAHTQDKFFIFSDGTSDKDPKQIQFSEMMGQPSWNDKEQAINFSCLMRADLHIGDKIKLPLFDELGKPTDDTVQKIPATKNKSRYSGVFYITAVHYYGWFRSKEGKDWNVTYSVKPFVLPDLSKDNDKKSS
ncbi:hypothetical protein PT277_08030 [Acetobacteraceae bacterium ESL0709]|nr:hypothetical protein [Acetobacteraceae bacterium ESL0697]MDF7678628.1 hypothetical protein [Acetobacteraceae bacterium ESL0709]